MIDKPNGKGEALLDAVIAACTNVRAAAAVRLKQNPAVTKIATAVCCIAVCGFVIAGYAIPKQVTVYVDDSLTVTERVYETTERTVENFLDAHDVDYETGVDIISIGLDAEIEDEMEIHITKAFDIALTVGGNTVNLKILPGTVADVIEQEGIMVGGYDIVEPAMDTQLKAGDEIVVQCVSKVRTVEEKVTEYKVVYQPDSSMSIGDTEVTQKGRNGKVEKTYIVTYTDGKETEKDLIETETIKKKKDKIISYGTKIAFGKPDGLQYLKKYENVRAVSYYFSGNPHGAYGLPCEFGTVAVDEDLIPLGSLLYIEGYGYAIANDVGTAIKGKTVDLYMEKYEQCLMWGARWTTVYVIDEA